MKGRNGLNFPLNDKSKLKKSLGVFLNHPTDRFKIILKTNV